MNYRAAHPRADELDAAEEGGGIGVLLRHVGFIGPNPAVQPRHQVDVVGDPPRKLLRRVHMRVHEACQAKRNQIHQNSSDENYEERNELSQAEDRLPTREDDAAAEVEGARSAGEGGEDLGGWAHGSDAVAGDGHPAVPEDAEGAVHGYDDRVVENDIDCRRAFRHSQGSSSARRASVRMSAAVGGGVCLEAAGRTDISPILIFLN
jgi:hypothetical protein